MKYRIITAIILAFVVLNLGGSTFADTKTKKPNGSELVSLLPESDGVVILDSRRFFNDALPKVLSRNQPVLAKVAGHIEKFQARFGVDIRQFDSIAAGLTIRKVGEKNYDLDPVIVARGGANSTSSIIASAKQSANGKVREERVGDRVMYIFDEKVTALYPSQGTVVTHEVAIAALDSVTVAFGDSAGVRQTLEGKTRISPDITGLLNRAPGPLTSFALKAPAGMKAFLPLENDELGKNIDSIKYVYGYANVAAEVASVHVTARTLQNAQATSLHETLQGLQMLGKAFLGSAKAEDKKVYARLIESAKFSVKANEVSLDLTVPQSDIDILVSQIK